MPRTIQEAAVASGQRVENDDLVNFGSRPRDVINPSTGPRSYWFRYGDICHLTLPQIQAAIGGLASAGQPGGGVVMRVSADPAHRFTLRAAAGFFGLAEYTIDAPVMVKCSIDVG
ncbi:MAG TPA: hypothetical protein VMP01_23060 [Pirellulaceae bacterium]|nr:hypothetical protein [Pirellulaceae bacterium]